MIIVKGGIKTITSVFKLKKKKKHHRCQLADNIYPRLEGIKDKQANEL